MIAAFENAGRVHRALFDPNRRNRRPANGVNSKWRPESRPLEVLFRYFT